MIKGHRLVLAELGLVPYVGEVLRAPETFADAHSRSRRAEHIMTRLAWMRALCRRAGQADVSLYRAIATSGQVEPPRNRGFVSSTFSRAIGEALFYGGQSHRKQALLGWQRVTVQRLFMTYLETAELNRQYRESEAVLLFDPDNPLF